MTLDTHVYLTGPITGPEAFDLAVQAILDAAGRSDERAGVVVETHEGMIETRCGQGLPAWTQVWYHEDGSPLAEADVYVTDEGEEPYLDQKACTVDVSWDTAYGYRDGHGGCSTLHARALILLGGRLPDGVTLCWRNEYSGEVYGGLTEADLSEFLGHGAEAAAWFADVVLPAVAAEAVSA